MVQENFLHYLWKYQFFNSKKLQTAKKESLQVFKPGEHNINSGPDFFNATLKIANQLWAGNVEIHIKASDWYAHGHEKDENYDNVVLHVVWNNDVEVYHKNNTAIPTLELRSLVSEKMLNRHQKLFSKEQKWIYCENFIGRVDTFVLHNWLEVLYFERLEHKSALIFQLLQRSANDWEAVLFQLLAKNFGLKVNGAAFLNLANSLDHKVVRKERSKLLQLEALFFGQAGFLKEQKEDVYYESLKNEYKYLRLKYHLDPLFNGQFQFFRLRPNNFPTIRLAQFAMLYFSRENLFADILKAVSLGDYYQIFSVKTSAYWESHYNFDTKSTSRTKKITKPFIDLLLINTLIPLKFMYNRHIGKTDNTAIFILMRQLKAEKNSVVNKFESLLNRGAERNVKILNALEGQAYLQLKTAHCNHQKCLQCAVGNFYLKSGLFGN